ncbi:hypothetical protein ACR6C2_36380 [Streptomyces sp. INA 01156]
MIGYYVHPQGSGHLHRARAVAAHCPLPVTGLSALPAPDDWPGHRIRLPRDDDGDPAAFGDVTAGGRLRRAPVRHPGFRRRMALIAQWIAAASPGSWCPTSRSKWPCWRGSWRLPSRWRPCGASEPTPHRTAYDVADLLLAPGRPRCPSPAGRSTGGPRRSTPARSPASTAAHTPIPSSGL